MNKLTARSNNNIEENIKTLRRALLKKYNHRKKKKRKIINNNLFNYASQKSLLQETNEIYDNISKELRKKWKLQLSQPYIFTSTLNSKYNFIFNSNSFSDVIDSGALLTSSPTKLDFVPGSFVPIDGVKVSGITSHLEVKGYGTVSWNFYNTKGEYILNLLT